MDGGEIREFVSFARRELGRRQSRHGIDHNGKSVSQTQSR